MKLPIIVTRAQFDELRAMADRYTEDDWEWLAGLYRVLGDEIVNWMRETRPVPPEFALEIEGEGVVYPYPPEPLSRRTRKRKTLP